MWCMCMCVCQRERDGGMYRWYIASSLKLCLFFQTQSDHIAQAGLELRILSPQSSKFLGLQASVNYVQLEIAN